MLQRALSLVFWVVRAARSIVLSLHTWLNPAWRVGVEARERVRAHAALGGREQGG